MKALSVQIDTQDDAQVDSTVVLLGPESQSRAITDSAVIERRPRRLRLGVIAGSHKAVFWIGRSSTFPKVNRTCGNSPLRNSRKLAVLSSATPPAHDSASCQRALVVLSTETHGSPCKQYWDQASTL